MNTTTNQTQENKWYDNISTLIVVFIFLPPVGIYGIIKHKTSTLKKLLYIFPASIYTIFILMVLLGTVLTIVNPKEYYKDGLDYYNKGNYEKAIQYFSLIRENEIGYKDAIVKIEIAKRKVIEEQALKDAKLKEEILLKTAKLRDFQKTWADSIVKSESKEGNRHLVAVKLSLPDSILFEYTKGVTINGFDVNIQNDTVMYRNSYRENLRKKFGNEFSNTKVYISCIPNSKVDYQKVLADKQAKAERNDKINRQFSAWDGSHRKLERFVKDRMNDPSSFDHVKTTYADKGSYLLVQMTYRGTNPFGALILTQIIAKVDFDGNVLSYTEN